MQIVYKSKYSEVCDLVGHPKPSTQEEEDYCQNVEFEHPEMAARVLDKMMKDSIKNPDQKSRGLTKVNSDEIRF